MFDRIAALAPVVMRLVCAYGEVVTDDVQNALAALGRRLWLGAIVMVGALLTLLLASTWLIAWSWDTPWRLWVIAALGAFFGLISLIAGLILQRREAWPQGLLPQTRTEIGKDRVLVKSLLAAKPGMAR